MTRAKLLLTSFDPFGGSATNPTIAIAQLLRDEYEPRGVAFAQLPVVGGEGIGSARAVCAELIKSLRPIVVVHLGEAQGRSRVSVERVAINLRDSRIPDNGGSMVADVSVVDGAPDAYFSTLPFRALLAACDRASVANELSLSAGAFLCNEVMYATLHASACGVSSVQRSGFIHVPQLPEQAESRGGPSMDAEESARGIAAVLEYLLGESLA